MKKSLRRLLSSMPMPLVAASFLPFASCSTTDKSADTYFGNVKYFHLKLDDKTQTADKMIAFERQHYLHGAVTREEQLDREGHYYVFDWRTHTPGGAAELVFEYRQQTTGTTVHSVAVPIAEVRKNNKTRIAVTGQPYHEQGSVTAWRAKVVRGGNVVAEDKSYLWD